jgi:hypothetical protein
MGLEMLASDTLLQSLEGLSIGVECGQHSRLQRLEQSLFLCNIESPAALCASNSF